MAIRFGALDDIQPEADKSAGTQLDLASLRAAPTANEPRQLNYDQASFLHQLEARRAARQAIVPTADLEVRRCLILLGEPMTLFGEGPYERRERLKELVGTGDGKRRLEELLAEVKETGPPPSGAVTDDDEFFVPGPDVLPELRRWLATFSLPRAQARLEAERQFRSTPMAAVKESRLAAYERLMGMRQVASQVGDERPLSCCRFAPDGSLMATGGFGGSLRVWRTQDASLAAVLEGHQSRTCGVEFHPFYGTGAEQVELASCAEDGGIALWSSQSPSLLARLEGHTSRVSSIAFHPSGRLLASASHDHSWRLWDLTTQSEVQLQEGHSRPLSSVAWHGDGAVLATGGHDTIARLWDARLGRAVWTMKGQHIKPVLSLRFAPSGYELVTASEDGTVCLWDIRALRSTYQLPAHKAAVTSLAWTPDGNGLVTASLDGTTRVWGRYGWRLLADLNGHDGAKIMAIDMSPTGILSTVSYDKTFKFWTCT